MGVAKGMDQGRRSIRKVAEAIIDFCEVITLWLFLSWSLHSGIKKENVIVIFVTAELQLADTWQQNIIKDISC